MALTLLASGSLLMLVSWFLATRGSGGDLLWINFAIILLWIGAILHLCAWAQLAVGLSSRSLARAVFGLSILAFILGILTLPQVYPPRGWIPVWFFLLLTGFFVLVPSIYGPAVALHGAIFMLISGHLRSRIRRLAAKLAALSLIVLGSSVLLMQILNPGLLEPPLVAPFLSLAGLTGFLYLALRLAWGGGDPDEREERLRAVVW